MATELPPIGLGAATGVDAAGPSERVQDWTEREVAEWAAFSVSTTGHPHLRCTGSTGRAARADARQLTDWKVKAADVNVILGRRRPQAHHDGALGWQVGGGGPPPADTTRRRKPTAPKQPKARPAPRGANAYGKPAASPAAPTPRPGTLGAAARRRQRAVVGGGGHERPRGGGAGARDVAQRAARLADRA